MDLAGRLAQLEEIVRDAKSMPLSSSVLISRDEVLELLHEMQEALPEEIKQARWIVKERQEMLGEAKREAERLINEAREQAAQLASQQEIVRLAERQAAELMAEARRREREVRLGAEDFADEILSTLETNLGRFLSAVQRGREQLQQRTSDRTQAGDPVER